MNLFHKPALGILFTLTAGLACVACSDGSSTGRRGAGGARDGTNPGEIGDNGGAADLGTGDDLQIEPNTGPDPSDKRQLQIREKTCDSSGNCTCLRLALLGTLDSAANQKDTTPFTNWLNDNSGGTATVKMISTKPTIDASFLSQYDVLLIANVNAWSFSASEKAAVQQWVRETGGGIVALTGFDSKDTEPAATSQLIDFSGIRFQPPKTAENGQQKPVYYQGGSQDLKNCLAWTQSSEAIITTPIPINPLPGSMAKLTYRLDYVGAFIGWTVTAPSDATVVAKDPVSGGNIAVAAEIDGKGRILAFGDEWIIYANQWEPKGDPNNKQQDQYNICWHPAEGGEAGFFHSVRTLYQTKQFWYDAINWAAPPNECNFVVDDPDVVPIVR